MEIAIIGGGASGFFGAISCATHFPDATITLYEKSTKLLSKVSISGGGRCNVTNSNFNTNHLAKYYPRGAKALKKTFAEFSSADTIAWFESQRVELKAEADGRMFPTSNDSRTIVECLISTAHKLGIKILTSMSLTAVSKKENQFHLDFLQTPTVTCDRILIASGGNPQDSSYDWLRATGHTIVNPVPSLFTFNIPNSPLDGLQGLVVKEAVIKIKNTDLSEEGITLVTHWGYSGPAVLRLSAWGARILKSMDYKCSVHFNWAGGKKEEEIRNELLAYKSAHPQRLVCASARFDLPKRFWERLCLINGIAESLKWGDLPHKNLNKVIESLQHDVYDMHGKTTFKEEFVTAGGISLDDVDMQTMGSKKIKGMFFSGEVLDVDGITGGYNFQAAWSTGWVAGKNMGK